MTHIRRPVRPTLAPRKPARRPQVRRPPGFEDPMKQLQEKLQSIPSDELRSLTPSEVLDLQENIITEAIEEVTVGDPNPTPRLGRMLTERQVQSPRRPPTESSLSSHGGSVPHRANWQRKYKKGSYASDLPEGGEEILLKREMRGVGLTKQQEEDLINEMTPMEDHDKWPPRRKGEHGTPMGFPEPGSGAMVPSTYRRRPHPQTTTEEDSSSPMSTHRRPERYALSEKAHPYDEFERRPAHQMQQERPITTTPFIRHNVPTFRRLNPSALVGATGYFGGSSRGQTSSSLRPASSPYTSCTPISKTTTSCPAATGSWVRQPIRMEDIQSPPPSSRTPPMSPPMSPRDLLFMSPAARQAFANQFPAASSSYVSDWGELSSLSSEFAVSAREDTFD